METFDKKQEIENWLLSVYKPKEVTSQIWNLTAICYPELKECNSLTYKNSVARKAGGLHFRYLITPAIPQTKSYQILYKILK